MSRHATDHREQDDVSNLLALEQRAERAASRAVLAFNFTAAAALICAAAVI